uniref:Vesicle transport protein n=1 Tax=Rhabditophanes sp. KR3021 TaxID=114890 RepID=A0AC35TI91_9BILA
MYQNSTPGRTAEEGDTHNFNQHEGTTDDTTKMAWDLRVQCFIGCLILSIVASICSASLLVERKMTGYVVLVSIGSIISICGSFFLSGPKKQLRSMFEAQRIVATIIYLVSIVMALVAALAIKSVPLALLFIVIQYAAMIWYSISYIPYARNLVTRALCSCF